MIAQTIELSLLVLGTSLSAGFAVIQFRAMWRSQEHGDHLPNLAWGSAGLAAAVVLARFALDAWWA